MYRLMLCDPMKCMSEKYMQEIGEVGDWYATDRGMHNRVFGATKAPHLLPKFILDKLALQEVDFHTFVNGFRESLSYDKK